MIAVTPVLRLALLSAALLAACNTGFEPQYRVRDLRVLAVKSRLAAGTVGGRRPR